jgi:hypothetical protein
MATFLNNWHVEELLMCADTGYCYTTTILHPNKVDRMKLSNWLLVCEYEELKVGDVIRFKFEITDEGVSRRCHIYKLN